MLSWLFDEMVDETESPQPRIVKFTLPTFDPNNCKVWFQAAEVIFTAYKIDSDIEKFGYLLQYLTGKELTTIADIIAQTGDRYEPAKSRLINVYGLSSEAELDKILSSVHIPSDSKPSVVLAQIKSAVGGGNDALIKRLWLKRLPEKMQDALEWNEDATLAQLATNADRLHEKYITRGDLKSTSFPVVAAVSNTASTSVVPVTTSGPTLDLLLSMMQTMQAQINSIQSQNHESRRRNRSPTPHRSRGRSNSRPRSPNIVDGLCWYHRTFNEKARGCRPGCKNYGQKNSQ